jgi:hypothetical protein
MDMEFEGSPMNEHARKFLSESGSSQDVSLPKSLNDALQNIFTKVRDGDTVDKNKFRKRVIKTVKIGDSPADYMVIPGNKNAIYNALCLLYLIGTGETKKLFQRYYNALNTLEKINLSILEKKSERQFLEFFCLGVVRESIDKISSCLSSTEFDLFTDKLPSPFSSKPGHTYDLSPMLQLYEQKIPWKDYMESYEKAEQLFSNKEIHKSKEVLQSLEQSALLRLPVVEALNKRIEVEENELKEAWDYFQKKLN